jgi:hypothetical protein
MPTDQPSGSSQMLRIALPSTFMPVHLSDSVRLSMRNLRVIASEAKQSRLRRSPWIASSLRSSQ